MRKKILFLVDIDGTLLKLDKTGRWVYQEALRQVLNKDISIEHINWIGTTDIEIIHKIINDSGISGEESITKMHEVFNKIKILFKKIVEETPEKIQLLPYAYEISEWIYNNFYPALLTGNIKEVAYMKLKPFGMEKFFPIGAFGDERGNRSELIPMVISRAQEYYKTHFDDIIVIGDSHRDIIAANANNLKSIIVLTGNLTKEELEPYNPYIMIDNLSFLPELVNSLEKTNIQFSKNR